MDRSVRYDYICDPDGPRGISLESWLERERLALLVIDVQNYITLPEYSGVWTASEGDSYYYSRASGTVLPNIVRLAAAFRMAGPTTSCTTSRPARSMSGSRRSPRTSSS
jgi:nicotinamidase-related amidase